MLTGHETLFFVRHWFSLLLYLELFLQPANDFLVHVGIGSWYNWLFVAPCLFAPVDLMGQVSSPSGPLVSLLHTTGSLLARPKETRQANLGMSPSPTARPTASLSLANSAASTNPLASLSPFLPESAFSAVAAMYEILGGAAGAGAAGAGAGNAQGSAGGAAGAEGVVVDLGWSNTTAATLVLYFLVHLNPSLRSPVVSTCGTL